jgi:hypothetical protein
MKRRQLRNYEERSECFSLRLAWSAVSMVSILPAVVFCRSIMCVDGSLCMVSFRTKSACGM